MAGPVDKLKKDGQFADFIVPIDERVEFRDATYFLRRDGTFVFTQGYFHPFDRPSGKRGLVSHIIFVPPRGEVPDYAKKQLFSQTYENITKVIMETHPPELFDPLQMKEYLKIDPSLDGPRPSWARYMVFVPLDSCVGYFPTRHSMEAIFSRAGGGDERALRIKRAIEVAADRLKISPDQFGMSGSVSLGNYDNPHDLDVVIHGSVKEIKRVVESLYELTTRDEKKRVYEFGKFWPIRYWEEVEGRRVMICPFFSCTDPDDFPLWDFTGEELGAVKLEGRVADHTYNAYNPTILLLDRVKLGGRSFSRNLRLILYHGAERGDYVEGDRVAGEGMHAIIRTFKGRGEGRVREDEYEAVVTASIGEVKKTGSTSRAGGD